MKIALVNMAGGESLGLASIATYLEKKGGFNEIRIIDSNFYDLFEEILKYNPDVIGISAFTVNYGEAIKLAEKLKEKTKAKIIIGGYHISTLPTSLKKCFDLAVIGEGEETFLELMNLARDKKDFTFEDLKKINGLAFFDNHGELILTKARDNISSLDQIPIINRDYIDQRNYNQDADLGEFFGRVATIETSRGCPYNCVFCSPHVMWKKTRFRSIHNVVEEIKQINKKYGIIVFGIADDLFTAHKKRLEELIEKLKEEGLLGKISFTCFARANLLTEDIALLLKKLNVKLLSFGFESGSERILKFLKCNSVTVEDNKKAILLCKRYNLLVQGNLLFGVPGEKLEDMTKNIGFIDFCIKNKTRGYMSAFVLTPFPGTLIWEIAKQRGKVSDDMDWGDLRLLNWKNPLLLDADVSFEDFKEIYQKAKKKMRYFHQLVWLERLKRHPIRTIKLLFSNGRIFNYFLIHKRTDI